MTIIVTFIVSCSVGGGGGGGGGGGRHSNYQHIKLQTQFRT
jgi:hypothetical protein